MNAYMASNEGPKAGQGQPQGTYTVAWKQCGVCPETNYVFKSPRQFCRHLRDFHCTKEGGSYVCRYGQNGVCPSLPLEGVSDRDYEDHVAKDHVAGEAGNRMNSQSNSRAGSRSPPPETSPSASEPNVVQDQHKWTIYNSRVNLPAALNDPRLSRPTDFFSKTWGESFERAEVYPSPHIPEITRDHFKRYLRRTAGRLKEHSKNSAAGVTSPDNALPTDVFPSLHARQMEYSRAELEAIPKIFMLPNFTLENPDTFNAVFPWTQIESARQDHAGKARQSSKLLQEKLSHYLDLVEVQIARQISLRSEAFFHAMSSHDKLQENMGTTCTAIKTLREKIQTLDHKMVEGPLHVMKLSRTRSNYVKIYHKLKLMSTVHQTQPTIQLLLSTSEFVGALDLISTTQEVLTQELGGIHSFRHLGSQLVEMEKLIDKMMQEDFVRYATADLNRPLDETHVLEEDYPGLTESQERLVSIVFGMLRQHKFNFIDVYREESCTSIKAAIKQTVVNAVAEADDIDTEGNVGSLADQMRLLNYDQWMGLLQQVFHRLLLLLHRVKGVVDVMMEVVHMAAGMQNLEASLDTSLVLYDQDVMPNGDITSDDQHACNGSHSTSPTSPSTPTTPTTPGRVSINTDVDVMISQVEYLRVSNTLREMLCYVCDHAHDRCVKLLIARAKDGFLERLSSAEFVHLSRAIERFVSHCESLCGRRSTSLRGSLQSQANRFVIRFHEERKTKLSLILDNERWKQADVPAEFQELVNHITSQGKLSLPEKNNDKEKKPQEFLVVDSQHYAVVGTVLMLLKMVVEYCQCVDDIPSVTPDILTRVVELLKMFNSRTCQLILGAGALQLVGLKTITTKNLALASRCLQLVVRFLPSIRTHFTERLTAKQTNMLKHFDHVLKDYNDHIAEIANKLVAIMDSMLDLALNKWEVKAPMPSMCFRSVCKQMGKLHEAITDLLPQEQIVDIFRRIHSSFKIHLRSQLIRLGVTNDGGPQHGLVTADVAFYIGNVRSLRGLSVIDKCMDDIWDKR